MFAKKCWKLSWQVNWRDLNVDRDTQRGFERRSLKFVYFSAQASIIEWKQWKSIEWEDWSESCSIIFRSLSIIPGALNAARGEVNLFLWIIPKRHVCAADEFYNLILHELLFKAISLPILTPSSLYVPTRRRKNSDWKWKPNEPHAFLMKLIKLWVSSHSWTVLTAILLFTVHINTITAKSFLLSVKSQQ